jgi:hypothetical protein
MLTAAESRRDLEFAGGRGMSVNMRVKFEDFPYNSVN